MIPLHLTRPPIDGGTLIGVTGELDCATIGDLAAYITQAHPDAARPLILDLAALTFLDSTGLHLLLDLHHYEDRHGGSLHLATPHERVTRVLRITGTDRLLHTYPTLEQALTAARLTAR
ncbi:STAS domain-containing protein [Nonomuraea typhae]|uniref:STAS domain-containing protein n=1 Tax=Nonomuraea typhae TaxID=2603600 RepID=UPI0012FC4550|nr:STAS domain-containing protein [Nonomuraea typhae]